MISGELNGILISKDDSSFSSKLSLKLKGMARR